MDKLNNVEFLRVYDGTVKGAAPVVTWTGDQVNSLTKTQLAHKIAELLGKEGQTTISYKLTNGARWIVQRIYAFHDPGEKRETKKTSGMEYNEIKKTFSDIYEMKAALLNEEISYLKSKIQLLTNENTDLKKQLEDEGGDPGGLVSLFTQLSTMTMQNGRLRADHRGTPGEIPPDIQAVLSRIDYAKLTPEKIRELAAKLQQAISFFNLPLKES